METTATTTTSKQIAWSTSCMAVYSSFVVILPALLTNDIIIRVLFTVTACVSILHHAYYYHEYCGKRFIDMFDTVIVHVIVAYCTYLAITSKQTPLIYTFYFCLAYVIYIYYIGRQVWIKGEAGDRWHVSLHFVAIFGTICLLTSRGMLNIRYK